MSLQMDTELVPIRRADDGARSEPYAIAGWGRRGAHLAHDQDVPSGGGGGIIVASLDVNLVHVLVPSTSACAHLQHLPVKPCCSVIVFTVFLRTLGENDTGTDTGEGSGIRHISAAPRGVGDTETHRPDDNQNTARNTQT